MESSRIFFREIDLFDFTSFFGQDDPLNMDLIFFREKEDRKSEYKNNLIKLNKFVMIKYDQDTMVTPKDSQWLITIYTIYLKFNRKNIALGPFKYYVMASKGGGGS